jgi:putative two-component system response regulator
MVETILVADDYEANRRGLADLLAARGYRVLLAANGTEALQLIAEQSPDCVLLDCMMPGGPSGVDVCAHVKRNPATCLVPVILVSGATDRELRLAGLEAGADDFLGKPIDPGELYARVRSLLRFKRITDDLESAEAVFLSLARMIEARDASTNGHCERLAHYAVALGAQLSLDNDQLSALSRGAFMHDIGKIGIPDSVLLKCGKLTRGEYELMKTHTVVGDELCRTIHSFEAVRPIVRSHHERLDGRGYPDGLSGEDIPLLARIVSVVDIFDALTTERPYRRALSAATAYQMLRENSREGGCDAALVDTFIRLHRSQPLLPAALRPVPARPDTAKCGTALVGRARKKRPVDRLLRA